jgi:hypothetical protein
LNGPRPAFLVDDVHMVCAGTYVDGTAAGGPQVDQVRDPVVTDEQADQLQARDRVSRDEGLR